MKYLLLILLSFTISWDCLAQSKKKMIYLVHGIQNLVNDSVTDYAELSVRLDIVSYGIGQFSRRWFSKKNVEVLRNFHTLTLRYQPDQPCFDKKNKNWLEGLDYMAGQSLVQNIPSPDSLYLEGNDSSIKGSIKQLSMLIKKEYFSQNKLDSLQLDFYSNFSDNLFWIQNILVETDKSNKQMFLAMMNQKCVESNREKCLIDRQQYTAYLEVIGKLTR